MSFDEFRLGYPTVVRTNHLMYEGILNAIKQYKNRLNFGQTHFYRESDSKTWHSILRGNKYVQSVLLKSETTPTAVERCNEYYVDLNWCKIFSHCSKITQDVQLRWFQMRVLHRLIPTEMYLHKCKIVESPLCGFCARENESIEHLFWNCRFVKTLWNDIMSVIREKCPHASNLRFDDMLVLFGISNVVRTDMGLDLLIIWAKFFIFKSKLQKTIPAFQAFLSFLKYRYALHKYSSIINGNWERFNRTWLPYQSLIDQIIT